MAVPSGAWGRCGEVGEHPADEPRWPEQSLPELLRLAFKDRVVTSPDHPVLRRPRGEA